MCASTSGWWAKWRRQSGFGLNEKEYTGAGTSTAHPGYVLSRQVPPTRSARSSTARSVMPASCNFTAAATPDVPAPTTIAWKCCSDVPASSARSPAVERAVAATFTLRLLL
jgi:hypothetical protein